MNIREIIFARSVRVLSQKEAEKFLGVAEEEAIRLREKMAEAAQRGRDKAKKASENNAS